MIQRAALPWRIWRLLGCCLAVAASGNTIVASDTARNLQLAVYRMNDWLSTSDQAEGWRRCLNLNLLESQMARGDQADISQLDQLVERFRQPIPGLDHPNFSDVRQALERHRDHLRRAVVLDIDQTLADPDSLYQPITSQRLNQVRDDAVRALQALIRVYAHDEDSAMRVDFAAMLQSQGVTNRLESLDFEQILTSLNAAPDRRSARDAVLQPLLAVVELFEQYTFQLSDPWFVSAQEAYDRVFRAIYFAGEPDLKSDLAKRLATLKEHLPQMQNPLARRSAALVGAVLGWLEGSYQADALVTAIRRKYSSPNAYLRVSRELIGNAIQRSQADVRNVEEVILGRLILGCANTRSQVSVDLVDDPDQVSASLRLRGQIDSDTYTRQGPITAFSGSHGEFEARRHIYANLGGLIDQAPYVAANLDSEFRGVDCRLRIVNRIAQQQYMKDKYLSEGIAAGRAERRILNEFETQTDEALNDAKLRVTDALGNAYYQSRWLPRAHLSSRHDAIQCQVHKSDMFHLAAGLPPAFGLLGSDVELLVHESLLTNYADPVVVGRTFTNEELAQKAAELFGEVPEAFQQQPGEEPWAITFPTTSAIQIELDDNRLRVAVTGRQFTQGRNSISGSLIIRADFKLVRDAGRLLLMRDGQVTVEYENPDRINARLSAFRTFLETKLNLPVAPGELPADALLELPPDVIPIDRLGAAEAGTELASKLKLIQLRAEQGWLAAGWKMAVSPNWNATQQLDLPAIHPWERPSPEPDFNSPDEQKEGTQNGQ